MIWDLHCHLAGVDGRTVHERMSNLIGYADRMGIERLVMFMPSLASRDPSPDEFRRQNDETLDAISHWHHRAFAFAYLNPKHPEESLAEIDRVIRDGPMVGVKLWVAVRCDDERLDAIVRRAAELKALIYQHTWLKSDDNLPGESTPSDIAALAARHTDVPLVCGHTGGNWELGVRELGAERVLYGSDVGGRSFASQLGKVIRAAVRR